jgi:hypothetical protein
MLGLKEAYIAFLSILMFVQQFKIPASERYNFTVYLNIVISLAVTGGLHLLIPYGLC